MMKGVRHAESNLYQALFELARSISGHTDLDSLCCGLARSLQRIVAFDYLGLILYDPVRSRLWLRALNGKELTGVEEPRMLAADDSNPPGWVWTNQKPLVIRCGNEETDWPQFVGRIRQLGVCSLALVPLTVGKRRVGVLGFGSRGPAEPDAGELAFLERVASEFAVTVDAHMTRQELLRERDRLRVLFDITNTLVSKLPPDELFATIARQLVKVIEHDILLLTLHKQDTGEVELHGLHFSSRQPFIFDYTTANPNGLPTGEALATGRPVVVNEPNFERFPSPVYRRFVDLGVKSGCSVPLVSAERILGTLEVARSSGNPFDEADVELLVQIARQIAIAIDNSLAYRELAQMRDKLATEKLYLEDEIRLGQNIDNMVGESSAFQALLKGVHIVAPTDATVLILGETGTGKELVARAIHDLSARRSGSFIKLSCAAIPATLLESELFGHEKGAFTGAVAQKLGRFELAHHGTLFLDEVGEIPLELQSKLLRAIQEQEFERLGGTRTIRVDIRLIAATNRNLKAMVDEARFRNDLYYRLHVFPLHVPPLRERRQDIPLLVRYFTQRYAQRMNKRIESIPSSAIDLLTRYDWPGNIRELQNVIERSVILTKGPVLQVAMPEAAAIIQTPAARGAGVAPGAEREIILRTLKESGGRVGGPQGAAARLGLKRTTLQSRMKRLGIRREFR
jgi:formate hydrogenlyase transcriptional activator